MYIVYSCIILDIYCKKSSQESIPCFVPEKQRTNREPTPCKLKQERLIQLHHTLLQNKSTRVSDIKAQNCYAQVLLQIQTSKFVHYSRLKNQVASATVFSKLARVSVRTDEESYNYRMIWVKGHLVQLSCCGQGHLQLHQVAQSPMQPELGCFQG